MHRIALTRHQQVRLSYLVLFGVREERLSCQHACKGKKIHEKNGSKRRNESSFVFDRLRLFEKKGEATGQASGSSGQLHDGQAA
ncbi:MAG: hypothetical protein M0P70_08535 [Desulfobulbaceae bacterium]|nr:hypothetical protein [Desulfobulbaceae bacterium]